MPRLRLFLIASLFLLGCKEKKADPPKLKKMDFKVTVDERGRMLPEIELYDQKHTLVEVIGSYTMTISRPDNTVLCSHTRTLAKTDYNAKRLKSDWQDATCPPDPAAEELRVTLEVKTGDKPEDTKLARDKTTPTKFIYRHLAAKAAAPANGSGSSAGSGDAKMVTPEKPAPDGTGSAAAGSNTGSANTGSANTGSSAAPSTGSANPGSGAAPNTGAGSAK
jgi:hypothetical protein